MEPTKIRKKRALSSEAARAVRQQGYDDALEFALSIGLTSDYKNDLQAKKDVIDPSGDAHSVKGGIKKWQVFLYSENRFRRDLAFLVMNGIGQLLLNCIEAFPPTFQEYQQNKISAKTRLQIPMRKLVEKLQNNSRLRAFMSKSIFNGGEVNYLTVKNDDKFHVFLNDDIVRVFGENLTVENSRKRQEGQMDAQKVVFKYKGITLGELEMRNDSLIHYKEIRFNMIIPKVVGLLFEKIPPLKKYSDKVIIYGRAVRKFARWSVEERVKYNKETSGDVA